MIKIRLSRGGRKNIPYYRILATNHTSPRDSKFLEKLGTYNLMRSAFPLTRNVLNIGFLLALNQLKKWQNF